MSKARDRYKRAKRLAWAVVETQSSATIPPSKQSSDLYDLLWPAYEQAQRAYNGEFSIADLAEREFFGELNQATLFPIEHPGKCFVCDGSDMKCPACKGSGMFEL